MPTIAFIMQTFYGDAIGGAERQVQILAQALRERGWRTLYICERQAGKPARETVQGMEVLALPVRKKREEWRNFRLLQEAMEQSRADLFYQRVRMPYTGLAARSAGRLRRPFVWAAASVADVVRDKDLRRAGYPTVPLDLMLRPLNRYLEDWGIRRADAVILQTDEQCRLLERNYGRLGTVIPNHVVVCEDLAVEKRHPPEVLWLSNIKRFKRPELFVELARRCRDLELRFVMAGATYQQDMREQIEAAHAELPNFEYMGPLEPAASEKRIAASTVLVNTSRFEGFPNAFQQAWCHGVPTLSLGVDPDGVIAREGLGSSAENLDGLEADLRRLITDPAAREAVGQRARRFARTNYDLADLLPRYLSLFEGLIRA
ncbi:MAG: glycosyltransferase [Candidatus Zixiibacteriota bacterium]|nr:MAG: glycosyltransferase [candidate division Zixibacteria bacterium]